MGLMDNLRTLFTNAPEIEKRGMSDSLLPATRTTSSSVSVGEAFSLPAVYRAVSTLAISAKQMGIDVVRNDRVVTSPAFIKKPNLDMSRSSFIEQTIISLASQGNAYWLIDRDANNNIVQFTPLNPLDMSIEHTTAGKTTKFVYQGRDYAPEQIKHMRLLQVPGNVYGLGPIQAAQAELHGALEVRDYASQWFENSGIPSGYLNTDQFLNEDQVAAAKEAWNATAGAKNGVAVLGNSFRYTPVYLKPEELQFLQVQSFSVLQVARLFGVPASIMMTAVEGSSMTYQNVSQEWLAFIRFSMMQYLIIIEDALSDFLPGTSRAKFNLEAILRADTTTRYAAHASALQAGWMTKNEVRAIEDLPELPEFEAQAPVAPEAPVDPVEEPVDDNNPQGDTNV